MLIDEIDFSALYQQQLRLAHRSEKKPEHWDAKAEKMAANCTSPTDSYLQQLLQKIDLRGAETLFDMGCGPGTVALALANRLSHVYGIDYSQGMLDVSARRADELGTINATWVKRAWEDAWDDLPQCDIAVASRSTLVADMHQAMSKLNRQAKRRVYTTHLVNPTFMSPVIQRVMGREVVELPTYIYALNVLYQLGIRARVDFINGHSQRHDNSTFALFLDNVIWTHGELTEDERLCLRDWYQQQDPSAIASPSRDWALLYWDTVPPGERG
ncbi:class I SAM-dependent methyltransferase [Cedecea sp.]|jgi:cyclopropane fatty-acyl-phospholipid synthase-like methyltransferase|uniref:class I SAM-dependent methyltransferase n=1 Tax=Cedecea sp. TaxID=1970739 RepID=UPI0012AD243C|nr:methyltransferase domain-containing protein [Enterobacteriaceae bacterium RIT693]